MVRTSSLSTSLSRPRGPALATKIYSNAVAPRQPSSGGVAAPPRTANSNSTGIGANRPAPGSGRGVGNNRPAPAVKSQPGASTPGPYKPTPWDAQYESSVSNSNTKYNNALISLGLKKTALQQDYGIDPGFNDYKANPYSRAALLEQSYRRANRASANSLASAGQLYSGASQNAESYNREDNARSRDELERLYRSALQQNSDEVLAAGDQRSGEISDAGWKRVEAAQNAPLEPVAPPTAQSAKTKGGVKYGISNNKSLGKKKGKK